MNIDRLLCSSIVLTFGHNHIFPPYSPTHFHFRQGSLSSHMDHPGFCMPPVCNCILHSYSYTISPDIVAVLQSPVQHTREMMWLGVVSGNCFVLGSACELQTKVPPKPGYSVALVALFLGWCLVCSALRLLDCSVCSNIRVVIKTVLIGNTYSRV